MGVGLVVKPFVTVVFYTVAIAIPYERLSAKSVYPVYASSS